LDLLIPALLLFGFLSILLNTVVGGGGGAVLVPALILIFNQSTNGSIATSFVAVTVGALVSTLAYTRQGRVDYRVGIPLAFLTIPGTILGALVSSSLQGPTFQLVLGVVILLVALLPLTRRQVESSDSKGGKGRKFTDSFGTNFAYNVNMPIAAISTLMGSFLSGIFGAGGALVLTPGLLVAGFPVHIALGTVRLVALGISLSGSVTRFYLGQVEISLALWLSIGAICGGIAGARLVRILNKEVLRKIVAIGISLLGLALILKSIL
jgi:uncharacterized membrane protein YfcA